MIIHLYFLLVCVITFFFICLNNLEFILSVALFANQLISVYLKYSIYGMVNSLVLRFL